MAELGNALVDFTSTLQRRSVLKLHKPGGGDWPTMVLSETRAEARHYSFVGLSEGAVPWPVRLDASSTLSLTRPGYLPSNPSSQNLSTIAEVTPAWSFGSARSSGFWLQILGVERFSFLPDMQRDGGNLGRVAHPKKLTDSVELGVGW